MGDARAPKKKPEGVIKPPPPPAPPSKRPRRIYETRVIRDKDFTLTSLACECQHTAAHEPHSFVGGSFCATSCTCPCLRCQLYRSQCAVDTQARAFNQAWAEMADAFGLPRHTCAESVLDAAEAYAGRLAAAEQKLASARAEIVEDQATITNLRGELDMRKALDALGNPFAHTSAHERTDMLADVCTLTCRCPCPTCEATRTWRVTERRRESLAAGLADIAGALNLHASTPPGDVLAALIGRLAQDDAALVSARRWCGLRDMVVVLAVAVAGGMLGAFMVGF